MIVGERAAAAAAVMVNGRIGYDSDRMEWRVGGGGSVVGRWGVVNGAWFGVGLGARSSSSRSYIILLC